MSPAGFDAERYLRRLGEEAVVDAEANRHRNWDLDMAAAAGALISCGAAEASRIAPLMDVYAEAVLLRRGLPRRLPGRRVAAPFGPGPVPPRRPTPARPATVPRATTPAAGITVSFSGRELPVPTAYLWQLLADHSAISLRSSPLPAALSALLAAGLISAEDPAVTALGWVHEQTLSPQDRLAQRIGDPFGRAGDPPPGVPWGWRALISGRTGSFTGPGRELPVGVSTPPGHGLDLSIDRLRSFSDSFCLDVQLGDEPDPESYERSLQRDPVSFWARDDRANAYLGHLAPYAAAHAPTGSGTVIEFAALDPSARALTLEVLSVRSRILIEVPL